MEKLVVDGINLREVTEPSFGQSPKAPSRAEIRRVSAENVIAAGADEVFGTLFEVLGNTDLTQVRPLSVDEVDLLAEELVAVRAAKDIIEGREGAIKKYTTEVIDLKLSMEGKDPTTESGYLVSPELGVKLSKEVTGGKLNIDVDLLKEVLESDQFASITNEVMVTKVTTYPGGKRVEEEELYFELNEEALEKELKIGNIGMEQIVKAALPGKNRTAFYVRPIK